MSFLFNFESPEEDEEENVYEKLKASTTSTDVKESVTDNSSKEDEAKSREITQFCNRNLIDKFGAIQMSFGMHQLTLIDTTNVEKLIKEDESLNIFANTQSLATALASNSDLVAGTYEGGLKIWECGIDLTEFLSSHAYGKTIEVKGKQVIELGCGAGVPGVYCLKSGAKAVDFQDYNEEVLQLLTHENVVANTDGDEKRSRYFCGDWSSLSSVLQREKLRYDIVLSAETIYNPQNYSSLHKVFDAALSDDGIIILSAKVYYFGVGGNVDAFNDFVDNQKLFSSETVHTIQAGVSRKIILLRRLKKTGSTL